MSLFDFLSTTRTIEQKLEDAVTSNNLAELDRLLQQGTDPNMRLQKYGGNTAMHFAAARGHFKCIECLISAGGHADAPNDNDVTPLYNAVRYKHRRAMQVLLRNSNGPMLGLESIWMSKSGSLTLHSLAPDDIVATLIIATPDVERTRPNLKSNLLALCRRHVHLHSLKMLLLTGCKLDAVSKPVYDGLAEQYKSVTMDEEESDEDIIDASSQIEEKQQQIAFRDWYLDFLKNPQSLQHCCRIAIRRSFRRNCNVYYGAFQIPLPPKLKNFLTFS